MKSSSPSDSKNIEIVNPETGSRIFRPTDALQHIIETVGFDKIMNGSVRHMGAKLLIRRPFKINLNTYKKLEDDLYLNRKGSVTDKFRTITILNSVYRLNYEIRLTTEPPTKAPRAAKTTRTPRKVKSTINPDPIFLTPDTFESSDFVYGSDGVLNLFDD